MFRLEAPYPTLQTMTYLPNPQFSDQEIMPGTVSRKTALDGTRYTYVKRRPRRRMKWTFLLTKNKAAELKAFLFSYFASRVRITDHRLREWIGYFTSNPFEFEARDRAEPAITPMPRGEAVLIDIEFEGELQ